MLRTLRAAVLVAAAAVPAFAQGLEVPAPSSKARVEQRVGVTDFSVDYSSPAARGRKIFGGLPPMCWAARMSASVYQSGWMLVRGLTPMP